MASSSVDLCDLVNRYGSDKDRNGYCQVYHTLFNRMRGESLSLLEIGIGTMIPEVHSSMDGYALPGYKPGGSLRAWRDYFPHGTIIGVDVQPDTQFDEPRIKTYLGNSTDKSQVRALFNKLKEDGQPIKFDIIIDDGSHVAQDQLVTLSNFYSHLKEGGIYIIEDIRPDSLLSTSPVILQGLCNNDPYFFVGVKNNICVIYKSHINTDRWNY